MTTVDLRLNAGHPGGKRTTAGIHFAAGSVQREVLTDVQLDEIIKDKYIQFVGYREKPTKDELKKLDSDNVVREQQGIKAVNVQDEESSFVEIEEPIIVEEVKKEDKKKSKK
jgi:hypothetical protein